MFFNLLMAKAKKKQQEYIELEYLESTGNQYLNLNYIPTAETGLHAKVSTVGQGDMIVCGSRNDTTTHTRLYLSSTYSSANQTVPLISIGRGTYMYLQLDGSFISASSTLKVPFNTVYEQYTNYKNSKVVRFIDSTRDITSTTIPESTFTPNQPLYLFAGNIAGAVNYNYKGKIYSCEITEGDKLVMDLIPVLDKDLVPCMYDKVSGKYFYNQGDGEFKWKLPNQLEYLESTGTQYINLGIIPNNTMGVKVKFYVDSATGKNYVIGSRGLSVGRFYLYSTENSPTDVKYGWGNLWTTTGISPVVGTPVEASLNYLNDRKYIYDGTEVNSNLPNHDFSGNTYNMYLFSANFANVFYNDAILKGRIYYCEITEGDKVIMHLIPVFDENLTPCMYDLVSKKYFYNKGTEQFKGYFEDGSQLINYLESDGNQWIDTGFVPSSNTRVIGSVMFYQWLGSANYTFGVYGDNSNFGLNVGSARTYFNVPWYNNSGIRISVTPSFNTIYSYDISKDGLYMNGQLFTDPLLKNTFQANKTMFIGWCNGTTQNKMSGRIYPHKIYENDVLVQYLIPVLDKTLIPCMYDLVSKQYLRNQGTGSFKGSDDNSLIV